MSVPVGLGERGAALWADTVRTTSLDPAGRVLLEEACRAADRLEQLHGLLVADAAAWGTVTITTDKGAVVECTLRVESVLAEARAQQVVLRGLLAHLRIGRGAAHGAGPAEDASPSPPTDGPGGGLDDLDAARSRRRAAAAAADGAPGGQ